MFRNKQNYQLGLTIIFFAFLYWNWKKWSVITPQELPQQSSSEVSNSLNGGFYYETSIEGIKKNKYLSADYRIWIPQDIKKIRGLIVKQHGCGSESGKKGLNHANDLQWQALALKHQFALMGTKMSGEYPMCSNEAIRDRAAETTFLKAMSALAEKTNHSELNTIPWVMWGHSGGADWGTQMLEFYPQRTIGVINVHAGGIRSTSGSSEILNLNLNSQLTAELLKVPVLWFVGEKDSYVEEAINLPKAIFNKFNQENSLWTLAIGQKTGHETGNTRLLAIPYLDAVITARMTDEGRLQSINPNSGWLGNIATMEIVPASKYQGDLADKVWLPDQETALKWKEHLASDRITPFRKPNAPTNVTITDVSPTKKIITWDFTPDLENGLPDFRIYRNGSLIKTLKGQRYDGGDVTNSPYPILEFRDITISTGSIYTVTAFNQRGENSSTPTTDIPQLN